MKEITCEIKNGYILFPEEFSLPEDDMVVTLGPGKEIRIYKKDGWEKLRESLLSVGDTDGMRNIKRYILSSAIQVEDRKKVRLAGKLALILNDGKALVTEEDGYFKIVEGE